MRAVFKIGDRALANAFSDSSLRDLEQVYRHIQTVLVHGGGDTVTRIAEQLSIPQEFITSPEGYKSRLTDEQTIEVYTMVMGGKVNKRIVRDLLKTGIRAVGLSGIDGGIIQATRKARIIAKDPNGRRRVIDGGFTGHITSVGRQLIDTVLSEKYLPVIAPIALGTSFEPLNVDGDRAASRIATAIGADLLVLLTDVDRILVEGKPVEKWSVDEAKRNLPILGPGMNTKVQAAIEAVSHGVGKAVIGPSAGESPYSAAIAAETGTVIIP